MDELFKSIWAQLGLSGLFLWLIIILVKRIYRDMRNDRFALTTEIKEVRREHNEYVAKDHERVMETLNQTNTTRIEMIGAINGLKGACHDMSRALEGLPCNAAQPVNKKFTTPKPEGTSP